MTAPATAEELFALPRGFDTPCAGGCGAVVVSMFDPALHRDKPVRCDACEASALARKERRARGLALEASIPDYYRPWARLDGKLVAIDGEERRTAAAKLARLERITFVGPAGAGKTSLAIAMLRARFEQLGDGGLFAHAHRLETARRRWGLGEGDPPEVDAALRAPVLLIDDLGFGEVLRQGSVCAEVIQQRHADAKPTWCTTGAGTTAGAARRALAGLYGDGTARRIFEGVRVMVLGADAATPIHRDVKPHDAYDAYDAAKRRSGDDS